jgi:hypothetical protein
MLVTPSSYNIYQVLDMSIRMEVHSDHKTIHHLDVSVAYAVLHEGTSGHPIYLIAVQDRAVQNNPIE